MKVECRIPRARGPPRPVSCTAAIRSALTREGKSPAADRRKTEAYRGGRRGPPGAAGGQIVARRAPACVTRIGAFKRGTGRESHRGGD